MYSSTRHYIDTAASTRRSSIDKDVKHKVIAIPQSIAGKHTKVTNHQDYLGTTEITTHETFDWNTSTELSSNISLYKKWVKVFQVSETICFARADDMQTQGGKRQNSVRLRDLFKSKDQYFLVSGVFQTYDTGKINPIVGASDWAVLTAQLVDEGTSKTSRIVLNEVCRAFVDKTKRSPTKQLLLETERVLKSKYHVDTVYLFIEDQRPQDGVSGPSTDNGKTLMGIYGHYGYTWAGWEDEHEFKMLKHI